MANIVQMVRPSGKLVALYSRADCIITVRVVSLALDDEGCVYPVVCEGAELDVEDGGSSNYLGTMPALDVRDSADTLRSLHPQARFVLGPGGRVWLNL